MGMGFLIQPSKSYQPKSMDPITLTQMPNSFCSSFRGGLLEILDGCCYPTDVAGRVTANEGSIIPILVLFEEM